MFLHDNAKNKSYVQDEGHTLRQNLAETSWSKTPIAIAGSEVKKTL